VCGYPCNLTLESQDIDYLTRNDAHLFPNRIGIHLKLLGMKVKKIADESGFKVPKFNMKRELFYWNQVIQLRKCETMITYITADFSYDENNYATNVLNERWVSVPVFSNKARHLCISKNKSHWHRLISS